MVARLTSWPAPAGERVEGKRKPPASREWKNTGRKETRSHQLSRGDFGAVRFALRLHWKRSSLGACGPGKPLLPPGLEPGRNTSARCMRTWRSAASNRLFGLCRMDRSIHGSRRALPGLGERQSPRRGRRCLDLMQERCTSSPPLVQIGRYIVLLGIDVKKESKVTSRSTSYAGGAPRSGEGVAAGRSGRQQTCRHPLRASN
jgi:hypothetical protein